jgi:hypothetical protein
MPATWKWTLTTPRTRSIRWVHACRWAVQRRGARHSVPIRLLNTQVISLSAANRPGLLTAITAAFRDLNLEVAKASVEGDEERIKDVFFVQTMDSTKIVDDIEIANIKRALEVLLCTRNCISTTTRPKFSTVSIQQDANKRELLYTLMGACGAGGAGRRLRRARRRARLRR